MLLYDTTSTLHAVGDAGLLMLRPRIRFVPHCREIKVMYLQCGARLSVDMMHGWTTRFACAGRLLDKWV